MRSSGIGSSSLTSSRPFLNLLNPLGGGRAYRGYEPARDDVVEEQDEDEYAENPYDEEDDRGEGPSSRPGWMRASTRPPSNASRIPMHGNPSPTHHSGANDAPYDDDEEYDDGEVPQSFLIEGGSRRGGLHSSKSPKSTPRKSSGLTGGFLAGIKQPISMPPRPSDLQTAADFALPLPNTAPTGPSKQGLDEYERALWNWVNVYNLDAFLQEAYTYYLGKGVYSIALGRVLNLLTIGFVIGFSTFLLGCVDYSLIPKTHQLSDAIVPHCVSRFSGFSLIFFLSFGTFYLWNIFTFAVGMRRLLDMYRFYTYLLDIPDADIQTIPWTEVVRRIGKIRESNPITALSSQHASDSITATLDAHDIANRILRQENYLIALFNKEVLDLRPPGIPPNLQRLIGMHNIGEDGKGRTLTRALEWNIRYCLLGFLFDQDGRVRKSFTTQRNKAVLVEALRRRFIFMGCVNAVFAPFIVLYLIMYSFFRYFEEYHKNPSNASGRKYTPYAQWKFREFNELPHIFARRLHESYPAASEYIEQFPNERLVLVMKFVSFVSGAFAAVLAVATVIDPDHFLTFEITSHRSALFYLTVFGSILAAARGMVPEEHRVYDTEELIQEVIGYTHYMPDEWKGRLHSQAVHTEFGHLFENKVMIFLTEMSSVILTPFILWFSLPPCSAAIVDFFRESTVHVDSLGYICSFAEFNFKRHGNVNLGAADGELDERFGLKAGKMEHSVLGFKAANPDWNPVDSTGSTVLNRLAAANTAANRQRQARFGNMFGSDLRRSGGRFGDRSVMGRQYATRTDGLAPFTSIAGPGATINGANDANDAQSHEQRIAERAKMYDSALQKSFAVGTTHRRSLSGGVAGGVSAAPGPRNAGLEQTEPLDEEDLQSNLEDSYVDGRARQAPGMDREERERDEEQELADGGVMGMLAQIYDNRRRGI
ncbi:APG9-domain-containing protein [Clavulina sp. PMI_390]|nr:APG9-domain-containing protein [Clavulina sp. PMI_390]